MNNAGAVALMLLALIVIIIIIFITCFKRQISRMKDRSRREPHIPGQEARKAMRREIERRLDCVADIYHEPKLISLEADSQQNLENLPYYYRMKTVDNMKYLEQELKKVNSLSQRKPRENIRSFMVSLTSPGLPLAAIEQRIIHELCDHYDHARHHPNEFGSSEFSCSHHLLLKILQWAALSGKAPSDHDSAIDEPEQDVVGDEENLIACESDLALMHRRTGLRSAREGTSHGETSL